MTKPLKADTLRRLERAAMRWYRVAFLEIAENSMPMKTEAALARACSAHAAAKAKRGKRG